MIPKFSIRQLLWAMVGIGLFSLCMSSAARGNRIAFGISVAIFGSVIPLSVYALVHWASFAVASFMRLIGNRRLGDAASVPAAVVGLPSDPEFSPELEKEATHDSAEGAEDV